MRNFSMPGLAVAAFCIMALMIGAASAADNPANTAPGHNPGQGNAGGTTAPDNNPGQAPVNHPGQGTTTQPQQGHGTTGNTSSQGTNPPGQWPGNPAGKGVNNPPGQWPANPPGQGNNNPGNQGQNVSGNRPDPGQGRPITPELFNQLAARGYEVSDLRSALESGNVTASQAWLDTFREDNPGVLDKLESARGVYNPDNLGQNVSGNRPDRDQGAGQRNHILTPEILAKLEKRGYNVSGIETALQNQDSDAIRTWLDSFRTENPGVLEKLQSSGPGQGNTTHNGQDTDQGQKQHILSAEFIQNLEKKGIDVEEFKAAFHTWLGSVIGSGSGESAATTSETASGTAG